jgi:hypothetical protein
MYSSDPFGYPECVNTPGRDDPQASYASVQVSMSGSHHSKARGRSEPVFPHTPELFRTHSLQDLETRTWIDSDSLWPIYRQAKCADMLSNPSSFRYTLAWHWLAESCLPVFACESSKALKAHYDLRPSLKATKTISFSPLLLLSCPANLLSKELYARSDYPFNRG